MTYLGNAISLGMLPAGFRGHLAIEPMSDVAAGCAVYDGVTHAIGHADTARLVESRLNAALVRLSDGDLDGGTLLPLKVSVPVARVTVALTEADEIIVAQYRGPRLPEGATTLPEGAALEFVLVRVLPADK